MEDGDVFRPYPHSSEQPVRIQYVYGPFWDWARGSEKGGNWRERFERHRKDANDKLAKSDVHGVLMEVFRRLYVLRNQIFHGGATFASGWGAKPSQGRLPHHGRPRTGNPENHAGRYRSEPRFSYLGKSRLPAHQRSPGIRPVTDPTEDPPMTSIDPHTPHRRLALPHLDPLRPGADPGARPDVPGGRDHPPPARHRPCARGDGDGDGGGAVVP